VDDLETGQDLQFGQWLRVLRRRIRLFVGTLVIVLVCAAALVSRSGPGYESEASIAVASSAADSATPSEVDIAAVVDLAQSEEVERAAQLRLGGPVSISVDNEQGSPIVTLTATARTPALAAEGANALAEALLSVRSRGDIGQFQGAEERLQTAISGVESEIRSLRPGPTGVDVKAINQLEAQLAAYESALSDLQVQAALATLRGVRIVSRGVVPREPVGVSTLRVLLIAGMVGLLVATMVVGVVEYADGSVRDLRSTETRRVLGYVPVSPRPRSIRRRLPGMRSGHDRSHLVLRAHPAHPAAETYRTIRTMLLASNPKQLGVLQVTSVTTLDGADVAAANLALSFALAGRPTILVSLDFRHPDRLVDLFPGLSGPGFAGVLRREVSLDHVKVSAGPSGNLSVVPSGRLREAPSDVLARDDARDILEDLATRDETVVILSPPVLTAPDAIIASVIADSTILIAKDGVTDRERLTAAQDLLTQAGASLLGIVVVDVPRG